MLFSLLLILNALYSNSVVPLGMMPSPFMILYFAIFLLTIAFISRGGYIGDINSLKSYVAVVVGCGCAVWITFASLQG